VGRVGRGYGISYPSIVYRFYVDIHGYIHIQMPILYACIH